MGTMYFPKRSVTLINVKGTPKFLARLFINDAAKMPIGSVKRTAMLSATGTVYGVCLLARESETTYKIVLMDEFADRNEAWIRQVNAAFDAEMTVQKVFALPYAGFVEGTPQRGKIGTLSGAFLVNEGFASYAIAEEAVVDEIAKHLESISVACGDPDQLETLRILARVGENELEIDETTGPVEAGFESMLDFSDESRVFIGRALTEARVKEGKFDRLQLVAFAHSFDPSTLTEIPLVIVGELGYQLTSIAKIPDMNLTVGLVQLPSSVKIGDQLPALVKTDPDSRVRAVMVIAPQA